MPRIRNIDELEITGTFKQNIIGELLLVENFNQKTYMFQVYTKQLDHETEDKNFP